MKIQIKSRYTNVIMHEYEEESLKIAVVKSVKSGADLGGADLYRADLGGADLGGATGYSESHDVFTEIVRRQKPTEFTSREWECIAHISIHRICWNTIKARFGNAAMRVFKKLAQHGFDEYADTFKARLKELGDTEFCT